MSRKPLSAAARNIFEHALAQVPVKRKPYAQSKAETKVKAKTTAQKNSRSGTNAPAETENKDVNAKNSRSGRTVKLYACGIGWDWDTDRANHDGVRFYSSKNAALDDLVCAPECGIVEVQATFKRMAVKPADADYWRRRSKNDRERARDRVLAREREMIALSEKLLKLANKSTRNAEIIHSAFQWTLGGLNRKRRAKRKAAREKGAK
jgi:hypothetical protein